MAEVLLELALLGHTNLLRHLSQESEGKNEQHAGQEPPRPRRLVTAPPRPSNAAKQKEEEER